MNTGSSIHTDPPLSPEARPAVVRAARTPFRVASQSSAANAILGVTTVALGGSPRLTLRAALVLLKDGHDSRSEHHGARTRRWVRRG